MGESISAFQLECFSPPSAKPQQLVPQGKCRRIQARGQTTRFLIFSTAVGDPAPDRHRTFEKEQTPSAYPAQNVLGAEGLRRGHGRLAVVSPQARRKMFLLDSVVRRAHPRDGLRAFCSRSDWAIFSCLPGPGRGGGARTSTEPLSHSVRLPRRVDLTADWQVRPAIAGANCLA